MKQIKASLFEITSNKQNDVNETKFKFLLKSTLPKL